jgi:alkylhydroperoxidase family enzyme
MVRIPSYATQKIAKSSGVHVVPARISPAYPPFPEGVEELVSKRKRDEQSPLVLFTTLARDERLLKMFFSGSPIDSTGQLSLRNREIVIDRICALSGSEYEWGVHVSIFGLHAGLTDEQIESTARGGPSDVCWTEQERILITACGQLHATCNIDDEAWSRLERHFSAEAILEILMLAGRYRLVSYLTNAVRMPLETWAHRFPEGRYPQSHPKQSPVKKPD